jgi:hypothetical protein
MTGVKHRRLQFSSCKEDALGRLFGALLLAAGFSGSVLLTGDDQGLVAVCCSQGMISVLCWLLTTSR